MTKTRDLQPGEAAYVDAGVVESADGRITWTRFEALVAAKVTQAAPALAREKEERARRATFAKKLDTEAHGMASFLIRADVATIDALDAAVTKRATDLKARFPDDPDLSTDDERRVRAILQLATGADPDTDIADLLPTVELVVHTYAGPDREAIARIEGHGPVTEDWVRDLLGPRARFTIRPVLDLAGQAPVDAYEIPERHRRAVHLMTPADTFPYASCTTRTMQVDHTIPYHHGGASAIGNYGPMTTLHHRIKTHGKFARPTTLPRHLPLARPHRPLLPRRPHRHPPPPPTRPRTGRTTPQDPRRRALAHPPPAARLRRLKRTGPHPGGSKRLAADR